MIDTAAWQRACMEDNRVQVLAKTAEVRFSLKTPPHQYLITAQAGRITITDQVTFNDAWDYTIIVPAEDWDKFTQAAPPPMYTTLQAMAGYIDGVELEGDRVKW